MRIHRRFVALVCFVVLMPSPAAALTAAEIACRDSIAKSIASYTASVSKVVLTCHQRRSAGKRPIDDDCNDVDQADARGVLAGRRAQVLGTIVSACAGAESLLAGYTGCPAPASSVDDAGASAGIDGFEEVGDCVLALADAHAGALARDAQGDPAQRLLDPLRKCQGKLGKGVNLVTRAYLQERRRCQKLKDNAGGGMPYACDSVDSRGRIAKSRSRFEAKVRVACAFSPEVVAKLGACAADSASLLACARSSADAHAADLIKSAYELSGDTSTTTTTLPPVTTTTLPPVTTTTLPSGACGSTFPQCDGSCPSGYACASSGSACNCVASGTGPCAPATIRRTIHAKYATPPTGTSLSTGWSGNTHDVDVPDRTGDVVDATCDGNCENCVISLNVQAGNPASNCRCTSDSAKTCTAINGSDPDSCGSLDPTCRCYFSAPLPLSTAGTPACVVNRIRQDYSGTLNLRTGEWSDSIRLAAVVYLGLSQTAPCPTCVGDSTANDGIRDGTCSGGLSSSACDANGVHATFGATSFDCLPTSATNISGTGLLLDLPFSTGSRSLAAALPCDTPAGELCPCRVCTGNGNLGCASDAECAAAGAGTCTAGGGAGVNLNQCENFQCNASGQCATGPVDMYCDGVVHPDGRGFIPCTGDPDCSANSAGTCTVADVRRCFPDPITSSGTPDVYEPVSAALFCIAPTSNVAVNLAAGLPGPGRLVLSFNADIRCQSDPSLIYEFPAGANCGGGAGTTTTTLLTLPDCASAASPVCGGVCPSGQACTDNAGVCTCTGLPLPQCADATSPLCGGVCPEATDLCTDNGGICQCMPATLPQCADAISPVCGGACPVGEICTDVGGTCECGAPGVPSCASAISPACAGVCDVGSVCVDNGGTCGCTALPLPTCAEATSPLCAGTCALGSLCMDNAGACQCSVLPVP